MANQSGAPGIQSRWDGGDLVFSTKAGVEVLRLGSDGVVSIAGLTFPTADGTPGQVLATNGSGTLAFADDATGA
jgi:hypothetical protein